MDRMRVLCVQPNLPPYEIDMGTSLRDLQEAVGGYIEVVYPFSDKVCIICNEEGKLNGMEPNRPMADDNGNVYDIICGPFLVAGLTEDNFGSLTDEQMKFYSEYYKEPLKLI